MKRLIASIFDLFLFCFLLIILGMPLIVSFNLDPELYDAPTANVAGVQDSKNKKGTFDFKEKQSTMGRTQTLESRITPTSYSVTLKIDGGSAIEEKIPLGSISIHDTPNILANAYITSDYEDINNLNVQLIIGSVDYNFEDQTTEEISLSTQTEEDVELKISSTYAIHFPITLTLTIRSTNSI